MKKIIITSLVLSVSCLLSCSKNGIEIGVDNLSVCPANSKCSYLFTEQADIDSVYRFKSGNYRLFWNTIENNLGPCKLTSTLWIKAPIDKNTFSLNTEDITKGLVNYSQNCSCCLLIGVKPISGYVKGINSNLEKSAHQTKWLIEAEIVLAAIYNNKPIDTLYVKQYFYPNFVYD